MEVGNDSGMRLRGTNLRIPFALLGGPCRQMVAELKLILFPPLLCLAHTSPLTLTIESEEGRWKKCKSENHGRLPRDACRFYAP